VVDSACSANPAIFVLNSSSVPPTACCIAASEKV